MQEMMPDDLSGAHRPIFGAGFVSRAWSGAMLEEGPGMIALGILMGAFCGLLLGLLTFHLARFTSFAVGRNLGTVSWALISMGLGAMAFGLMTVADKD